MSFVIGRVSFIKLFGLGLTLAVLMDAFLVRGTLVPAFMRLAGDWNWWAPRPLRRLYARWGISEHVDLDGPAAGPEPVPAPAGAPDGAAGGGSDPAANGGPDGRQPALADEGRDPGVMTGDRTGP
jgi:RND superfamily putative drug exporter